MTWNPRKGSLSRTTGDAVAAADRTLERRGPLGFRSCAHALRWYWAARERMQSPRAPRLDPDHVGMDGGAGGHLDDVLVTISAVGTGLRLLQAKDPRQAEILVMTHRYGMSLRKISERAGLSHQQVSAELGRGEAWLAGWLQAAEVLL